MKAMAINENIEIKSGASFTVRRIFLSSLFSMQII
jgi:hypothetical protein